MKLQLWDTVNNEPDDLVGETDISDEELIEATINPESAQNFFIKLRDNLL